MSTHAHTHAHSTTHLQAATISSEGPLRVRAVALSPDVALACRAPGSAPGSERAPYADDGPRPQGACGSELLTSEGLAQAAASR